jgi:hypothetical protein
MTIRSLLVLGFAALAVNLLAAVHLTGDFRIRLVDQRTGQGIPNVRITSDSGTVCYTDKTGTVRWNESDLMGRDVKFHIDKRGYDTPAGGATLHVSHFGSSVITVATSK